jgi:thiol-disulfide isomerase/thioredoxin
MEMRYKKPVPEGIDFVTDETIEAYLVAKEVVILVVGAAWCPDTIRMATRTLPDAMLMQRSVTHFAFIYAEEARNNVIAPETVKKYGIRRYPTLILIKRGKVEEDVTSEGSYEHQIEDIARLLRFAEI